MDNLPEVASDDETDLIIELGTDDWKGDCDCDWLQETTGLTGLTGLVWFVIRGGVIITNDSGSCVRLVEANYYESPQKCVYCE